MGKELYCPTAGVMRGSMQQILIASYERMLQLFKGGESGAWTSLLSVATKVDIELPI